MTRNFEMNGKTFTSMSEIAKELGVNRIRPRDFTKYGITEVMTNDSVDTAVDTTLEVEETPVETVEVEAKDAAPEIETKAEEPKKAAKKSVTKKVETTSEPDVIDTWKAAGAISIPDGMELSEFAKKLRRMPIDDMVKYAGDNSLNTYDDIANEPIKRMRLIMALKEHFYPDEKLDTKKSSAFRKIPLDTLIAKADELELEYRKDIQSEPIQRMWVTKALLDAGITIEDVTPVTTSPSDDSADSDEPVETKKTSAKATKSKAKKGAK